MQHIDRHARLRGSSTLALCAAAVAWLAGPALAGPGATGFEPGQVAARPTWCCMGVNWQFTGDSDRTAKVTLDYRRKGTAQWRPALAPWLHDVGDRLMFSGSVFRLAPGTEYEFRLIATDDGPAAPGPGSPRSAPSRDERIVAARTLDYPALPKRSVELAGGGLVEAQKLAEPGTVIRLPRGQFPGTVLNKSGRPEQWIVYQGAPDGGTVITSQVRIEGEYVWLDRLTLADPKNAVQGRGKGACITRCRIRSHYAIHTGAGAENYFIADNRLTGDSGGKFTFSGEGVDFGGGRGECGHAVCFNEITDFADGVSYGRGDIDVYNNYIHETVDDFIEPDYSAENYRLWNNRCYNSMCGFSWQPMRGGPWYMFNNVNVGAYLHCFKLKSVSGATVVYGNTIVTKTAQLNQAADLFRGQVLNNVWLRTTPGSLGAGGRFDPGANGAAVDYNAYGNGGGELFVRIGYSELAGRFKWDAHSLRVQWDRLFNETIEPPTGEPRYWRGITGHPITRDWQFNHPLLTPRPDSPLIDAGTVLPNLTGPYLGKAPDLGAHEAGLGTPWHGPRTWDDQAGLIYGLPEGWTKARPDAAGQYAHIGCPVASPGTAPSADVLLVGAKPRTYALLRNERCAGEDRWTRAKALVAADAHALTPVLEFQDGFYIRLYADGPNARLVASRVETDGVLHVTAGCAQADLPAARLTLFQFARSLVR